MTGMAPSDVYELTGVTDPRVSPDGRTVAFVVGCIDEEANDYRGRIWLAAADGDGAPRAFTSGSRRDAEPCWSPDGSTIAFTSNRDDGKTMQLFVMPVGGGEPRRLTDLKENVTQPAWSPDGSTIAFVARVRDEAYDESDDRRRRPRRFTRLQFKLDHVGWTADRPQHLFTVKADGSGEPVQITDGDFEDSGPRWSPDGATIAFVSARHPFWDTEHVTDIYLVAAGGGEPRRLTRGGGSFDGVSWSPDGTRLAGQRYPAVFDDPRHTQIAIVEAATGDLRLLTQSLDRNCSPYPPAREPVWDGEDIVFLAEDRGNTHLYRVAADGAHEPQRLVAGERIVTAYDLVGGRLAFAATTPTALSELFVAELPSGGQSVDERHVGERSVGQLSADERSVAERRLTHVGDAFAAGRELMAAERFTAVSRDGTEVEAWVMRPAGFEAGRTYPALLNIHGGPFTQYGNTFFDEFQVYCGGGYAVVFANPRGSSGYSEAWGRAIRGPGETGPGWGSVDADDCLAVIDEAIRRFDFIDGARLGVIGGSYGGFMTSWLVGHTDRFKAAVSERAVNQWVSMWGSSDFGWDFKGYFGKFLFEDVDAYLEISPVSYAADIHTPLLILHSENDLRCPIEQGEQLFTTLRLLRRDVELVRFPEESHELTRSGSPLHRVQRFEIVLEWFDRYLK